MSSRIVLVAGAVIVAVSLLALAGVPGVADEVNETVHHEHPAEAEGEADEGELADWFRAELDERLGESSVLLDQREYDAARTVVGDEYDEILGRYAEVEDDVDEDDESRSAEDFEEARDTQRELVDDVEEYDRTYEEYREAVDAGEADRARELARDLDELAASIEEGSERAEAGYERSEDETDRDTSAEREAVGNVREEIETRHAEIEDAEFVETTLTVEADSGTTSFDDPLALSGTVTTEDGAPVANEPITLAFADREVNATTDADGSFEATYRPTLVPLNTTDLEIEYVPERGSAYAGSGTTLPIVIEPTEPTVEVTEHTESVAFGEELSVDGTVGVDGETVESVPIVLVIEGEVHNETVTDDEGAFSVNESLPADVPAEDADVRVATDLDEQALSNAEADVPVEVETTPSALELEVELVDGDGAILTGELSTADGDALEGQPIEITVDDETIVVETDGDGSFERTLTLPEGETAVTITVSYENPESNVEEIEESITVERGGDDAGPIGEVAGAYGVPGSVDVLGLGLLATLVGLVLAFGVVRRRLLGRGTDDGSGGRGTREGPSTIETIRLLLTLSRRRLWAGETDDAIRLAYAATRLAVGGPSRARRSQTPWEFYEEMLSEGLSESERRRLRSLTSRFERAAFAPTPASESDATDAVGDAEPFAE